MEEIGEDGFWENPRLISVKKAQTGSYEREQKIHRELPRLHRELGRDSVGGKTGDRWTSVSTRDNFP